MGYVVPALRYRGGSSRWEKAIDVFAGAGGARLLRGVEEEECMED